MHALHVCHVLALQYYELKRQQAADIAREAAEKKKVSHWQPLSREGPVGHTQLAWLPSFSSLRVKESEYCQTWQVTPWSGGRTATCVPCPVVQKQSSCLGALSELQKHDVVAG